MSLFNLSFYENKNICLSEAKTTTNNGEGGEREPTKRANTQGVRGPKQKRTHTQKGKKENKTRGNRTKKKRVQWLCFVSFFSILH
jgi:hypothetical protein